MRRRAENRKREAVIMGNVVRRKETNITNKIIVQNGLPIKYNVNIEGRIGRRGGRRRDSEHKTREK